VFGDEPDVRLIQTDHATHDQVVHAVVARKSGASGRYASSVSITTDWEFSSHTQLSVAKRQAAALQSRPRSVSGTEGFP
jgi:hypothetical protein